MSSLSVDKRFFIPALAGVGILIAGIVGSFQFPLMMAGVSVIVLLALTIYSLELSLYTLFIIRPSLDILSDFGVNLYEGIVVNVAALVALYGMLLSGILIVKYWTYFRGDKIPLLWLIVGYWLVNLVFVPANDILSIGVNEIIRVTSFMVMFVVMFLMIESEKDYYSYIKVVILSAVFPALIGLLEFVTGAGLYSNPGFENRIAGTFGHPNVFAYYLMIVISLIGATILHTKWLSKGDKPFLVLLAVVFSFLLIQTFTRGAWIGLFLIGYLALLTKYTRRTIIGSILIVVFTGVLSLSYISVNQIEGVSLPPLDSNPLVKRFTDLFAEDPSDSVIWRRNIWADMFEAGLTRPITAHGTGSIEYVTEQVRGLALGALEVHNDYIKVFVEMGVIGLLMYLLLIAGMLAYFLDFYRTSRNVYILVVFYIVIALYFSSFYDNLLRQTANMWIFFGLVGATIRYGMIEKEWSERAHIQPRIRSGRSYVGGERPVDIDPSMPKQKL
jgi:putative inorganic carbon (HCO3(-)) transporter